MENESEGDEFCGGFTYELVYESGPLKDATADLSFYDIEANGNSQHLITGTVQLDKWIGTHQFVIRGTNGAYNRSANARGVNGLFNSVDSDPFTIDITNPCQDTILDPNRQLDIPSSLSVP